MSLPKVSKFLLVITIVLFAAVVLLALFTPMPVVAPEPTPDELVEGPIDEGIEDEAHEE